MRKQCRTCATCIQEDQLVLLDIDNNTAHINELCEDDIILGFDIVTKDFKRQRIKSITRTENVIVTKYEHHPNSIICTANHKVLNLKHKWVKFEKCFDTKLCLVGPSQIISLVDIPSLRYIHVPATVYNLETEMGNFIVNGYIVKGI